ncbi:hypothetical protein BDW22DRAFT_1482569 [Trametopsis cervina]|nr:hypothetical protein BDW22DRAFT_1482569 [Trametopsis cervina]
MANIQGVNFELFCGPFLMFIAFALMLFGVFSAQCYFYWFASGSKDSQRLRYFVLTLWILETIHTAFCMHVMYTYFIINFGNIAGVQHVVWSAVGTILLELFIVSLSEGFYILRIYRLSGSFFMAAIPAIFLVPRVVLGFVVCAYIFKFETWDAFRVHDVSENLMNVSLSLAAAADVSITALITYYLRRRQSKYARTRHIIQRLQRNTVNNGALAVVLSVGILAALHGSPKSLLFAGLVETSSKVYANAVIATLNAREFMSKGAFSSVSGDDFNALELTVRQTTVTHVDGPYGPGQIPVLMRPSPGSKTPEKPTDHDRKTVDISVAMDRTTESLKAASLGEAV